MPAPLFTILIPTRNRADLARSAIVSASRQDGEDVEIIVSENSTDADAVGATRTIVEGLADPRIRLIRPPEPLEMPAHWEWATRHATGEYLLILTDRFVMRPGVLDLLRQVISERGRPEILRWTSEAVFPHDGSYFERPHSERLSVRDGRAVLAEFATCGQWRTTLIGNNNLPRGLNSAVRGEIIDRVREKYGSAYQELSPDYTSAFHQLIECREQVDIDAPLYVSHGNRSNGASSMRDGVATYLPGFRGDRFEGCPVPIDTVMNTTIRDYLWIERTTGADLPPIDMVGYLLLNWRELQIKAELGSRLDLAGMRRSLMAAAEALPPDQRAAFNQGRREIDSRETRVFRLRNRLARLRLLEPIKALLPSRRPERPRYASVLDAVQANPIDRAIISGTDRAATCEPGGKPARAQ